MTFHVALFAVGALAAALIGCSRDSRYPGSELAPDESAAIGRIAFTRLTREQACRPRGPTGEGLDVEGRMKVLRSATAAEIKPSWCKSNIHPRELDACVSQIQSWPCDVELRKVTLIETCRAEPLCGVPTTDGTL